MARLTPKIYAVALEKILADTDEKAMPHAIRAWLEWMNRKGDMSLARRAVGEFEHRAHRCGRWHTFRIEIARRDDENAARVAIHGAARQKNAAGLIRVSVRPALMAGARIIRNDSILIDASLKRMIDRIFS